MKSILIVDDSAYYRSRGAEIAELAGFKCHFAENGEQAVRMYHRIQPDIVTNGYFVCLLWIGLEATKQICSRYPNANILICSSVGHVPVYRRQAYDNGAKGILPKEYDLDELEFAIKEIELMK